jgi:hypothetical protein
MRFRTIGGAMASRKKRRVYAFPGSATNLEERIAECKSKIDDPSDKDDKQWLLSAVWQLKSAATNRSKLAG